MTLDEYIADNDLTDKSFGERIGKSRIQIYRYRHGLAVPRPNAIKRITEATKGQVTALSFYPPHQPRHRRSKPA